LATDSDDIRVVVGGRELPVQDVQAHVTAALIVGAIAVAAWVWWVAGCLPC